MLFIKNENLKTGMRLAKPIYNKKGVLLYDRNSKLTLQGIDSVKNFGLIGIYILEPAEPVPPMTQDDIEFERFQTMSVFSIQEELLLIKNSGKAPKMQTIASTIIKSYGRLDKKINFIQSLRSNEDYIFKHSLNCAVLCAMMTHVLNVKLDEQLETVIAAVVHDIGKLNIPKEIQDKAGNLSVAERAQVSYFERQSAEIVENTFASNPGIKRIVTQAYHTLNDFRAGKDVRNAKLVIGAKVMIVAEVFDTMTAMNHISEPSSEVAALRFLMENPIIFDPKVVNALIKSMNFLNAGCCIELSNGEKGLVIVANEVDILKPIILCFSDNRMIDLSQELVYEDLMIKDVMKTMDNRCVVDKEMVKQYGFASKLST
ncbi:MAG: HD domain-containing protein [Lachnospiraceae bacterium]|nr:HD domain-containing protein [Lachnospiraceae bacterium]